jgi:hypothetical protein
VQVDPIKPTLKAPGIKGLRLEYDILLSSFAFNFNLRRYTMPPFSRSLADEGAAIKAFKLVKGGVFQEEGITAGPGARAGGPLPPIFRAAPWARTAPVPIPPPPRPALCARSAPVHTRHSPVRHSMSAQCEGAGP